MFKYTNPPSVGVLETNIENKIYRHINSVQKLAILVLIESVKQDSIKQSYLRRSGCLKQYCLSCRRGTVIIEKDNFSAEFENNYDDVYSKFSVLWKGK